MANNTVTIEVSEAMAPLVKEFIAQTEEKQAKSLRRLQYESLGKKFWNDHVNELNESLSSLKDEDRQDAYFKWNQLVNQEIWMYASIAEPVDQKEFDDLCVRRGFSMIQRDFLVNAISFMGMGWKKD